MAFENLSCLIGPFEGVSYLALVALFILVPPFIVSGLVRIALRYTKYDARKANRLFWILWLVLAALWLLFLVTFSARCAVEAAARRP